MFLSCGLLPKRYAKLLMDQTACSTNAYLKTHTKNEVHKHSLQSKTGSTEKIQTITNS